MLQKGSVDANRSTRFRWQRKLIFLKTYLFVWTGSETLTLPSPPLPRPTMLVATLTSEGGDGRENVAEKVNSRSSNLHRDYFKSLTLSNLGEPS